ncbi:dihydrofolate reductase [Catalinimonas alkaloidigena]|uniref:Dihydrofolate reductase n=1 Tax=Catalinimonas alkaloidigena TaxID=1075417 RepID=A0A1G8XZ34_9BACT|nr:dihydrofolate reductase [Catalinimonas alkaloidigena]SDJ95050.1 dihydrofolate reductase [Catalinimonas alkaloidigena]
MILSIIAAVADNGVIGKDNDLPWHLPDDLRFFKRTTLGHYCLMGRKVFESFGGKALPRRPNVVITRNPYYQAPGAVVVHSLKEALALARHFAPEEEVFVLGGGEIYVQSLDLVDKLYLTHIHADIEGDTYFPDWQPDRWTRVWHEDHPADDCHAHPFTFALYERKK